MLRNSLRIRGFPGGIVTRFQRSRGSLGSTSAHGTNQEKKESITNSLYSIITVLFPPTKMMMLLNLVFVISMHFVTTCCLCMHISLSNICWILYVFNLYVNDTFLCVFIPLYPASSVVIQMAVNFFISTAVENFLEWIYDVLFIQWMGHLGCYQIFAITYSVAMIILCHGTLCTQVTFL